MAINPILLQLAREQLMKQAVVAPMDPAAMGGMPPGAPPMDPAMMGGMPPPGSMPPGDTPMDPAMMGGAPPMDPAMMAPPPEAPAPAPVDPAAAAPVDPAATAVPQKRKPEDFMQEINGRLHNIENQMAAIMNLLQVSLPPDAAIQPLGGASPADGGSPEKKASFANRDIKLADKVAALTALMRSTQVATRRG